VLERSLHFDEGDDRYDPGLRQGFGEDPTWCQTADASADCGRSRKLTAIGKM
jgi:hypothetical protein